MKTRLSQICIAITMFLSVSVATAQQIGGIGGQQSAFQAVQGDLLQPGLPGRLWLEANFADQGLGYNGSYLTLGGKTRLFQDRFDGRWLLEGQVHQSIDNGGGFFANVGLERVFSVPAANADISVGAFYDYDGDDQQDFSDGFNQLGISGAIKTQHVDLIGNGYFPVGTDSFNLGDVTGINCFVGNNIALQAGIESALEGFDVTLRTRPKQLAFANGYVDFGGYHYDADLVESFAGGRLRVGVQLINSLRLAAEINQDERFDTTGAINLSWTFGNTNSGFGSEYAGLARDLEKFSRNDHIVRFSQDLIVAINPLTGQPINVVHANNTQTGTGDGTDENPFATLAEAEAASSVNDVIFVDSGDGTDTGYSNGITLQAGQQLLSGGGTQFVQNADGTLVSLSKPGVSAATISNAGGNEVVLLSDNNIVGGINIDAREANFGIFGVGVETGIVNQTTISGAVLDGVGIQDAVGSFSFTGNTITGNMRDGVFIDGATGSDAVFNFADNIVDGNVFDGIHLVDYEADTILLTDNQTSTNGRHGVYLENALDPNGNGTDILVSNLTADANGGNALFVEDGSGRLAVTGGTFTNNAAAGIAIRNFETALDGDGILIGAGDDGIAPVITDNTMGINLAVTDGTTSTFNITEATVDTNGIGIVALADEPNSVLNLNVTGTTTANGNGNEAILHVATDGGTINSLIESTDALNPLVFANNSFEGGPGISYVLDSDDPLNPSTINAVVRNINVTSIGGSGLNVDGAGESQIDLLVEDSLIQSTNTAVNIVVDNNGAGLLNRTFFDNNDIRGNVGFNVTSQMGTLLDFSVSNTLVRSAGIISDDSAVFNPGDPAAFGPFTDGSGANGIVVTANGNTNLTRVNLVGNTVEDFTFDGIVLTANVDAQLFANIRANRILRNGPGLNDDGTSDNGIPFDSPVITANPTPTEGSFFNGLTVTANDQSVISLFIDNNTFLNNFDRSIALNTNALGSVFATLNGNRFSSDIGIDATVNPLDPFNGEIGLTHLGANMCVDFSSNTFRANPIDIQPGFGDLTLGFDGLTNGIDENDVPGAGVAFTPTAFGLCDVLIDGQLTDFENIGFVLDDH